MPSFPHLGRPQNLPVDDTHAHSRVDEHSPLIPTPRSPHTSPSGANPDPAASGVNTLTDLERGHVEERVETRNENQTSTLDRLKKLANVEWYTSGSLRQKAKKELGANTVVALEAVVAVGITARAASPILSYLLPQSGVMYSAASIAACTLANSPQSQRAIQKLYTKILYKPIKELAGSAIKIVSPPTRQDKTALKAYALREASKEYEAAHPELEARFEILDNLIDTYVLKQEKPGKPDLNAFTKTKDILKTRELFAEMPYETVNISGRETFKDVPLGRRAELEEKRKNFDDAKSHFEDRAEKEIEEGKNVVSNFMTSWADSGLPGEERAKKSAIAIIGDSDIPEEMCKKFGTPPVKVQMNHLVEFIEVQLSKDVKSRLPQKTTCPIKQLGPFHDWIKSGNAACPIIVDGVDFKNPEHVRVISLLLDKDKDKEKDQLYTKIPIHYSEAPGLTFDKDISKTPFFFRASTAAEDAEILALLPHATVKSPSKEKRLEVLETELDTQVKLLEGRDLTRQQKEDIAATAGQQKDLIVQKSMEHDVSLKVMKVVMSEVFGQISEKYRSLGSLEQNQPLSAEGDGASNPLEAKKKEKKDFDNRLEKIIEQCFSIRGFKKDGAKDAKDEAKDAKEEAPGLSPQALKGINIEALRRDYPEEDKSLLPGQKKITDHFKRLPKIAETRLQEAAQKGELTVLQQQLDNLQIDPNKADQKENNTALHFAAQYGHPQAVDTLMKSARVKWLQNKNKDTPLHLAAQNGHVNVVRVLLQDKKTELLPNKQGYNALQVAAAAGHADVVAALLEAQKGEKLFIDPNLKGSAEVTALQLAIQNGKTDVVRKLLQHPDIDINVQNEAGQTALHLAVKERKLEMVRLLLEHKDKIDFTLTDTKGVTVTGAAGALGIDDGLGILEALLKANPSFSDKNLVIIQQSENKEPAK